LLKFSNLCIILWENIKTKHLKYTVNDHLSATIGCWLLT
jgi:hypothetical protein